jgi:gamma-butyrobetaine dioxygenase
MSVVEEVFKLFAAKGDAAYFGEPVSQTEHALQAAHLAEEESAPPSLVVAALLHDVGHLIHGMAEDIADQGVDARHEAAGEAWLARYFDPDVTEPVKLHVAAKRYLCRVDPAYGAGLSPASVQSLELQGGPFSGAEAKAFQSNPHFRDAVRLRRWDDLAKVSGLLVPNLEYYRAVIASVAKRAPSPQSVSEFTKP